MAISGLTIIGETINDSVPSTKKLFDAGDMDGVLQLARMQDEQGAAYIDINIGPRSPEFMADIVRRIQAVTARPLSIDTPDPEIAKAGLAAYDVRRTGGQLPLLNSISELRTAMFDLYRVCPFRPILLVSEQVVGGRGSPCRTAEETHACARRLVALAWACAGIQPANCIVDPGVAPIASDTEGNLKRLLDTLARIHSDGELSGVSASVGLSNFTVMLPSKRADGSPVKGPLESAFLTKAMPFGLNMVIGSVKRRYGILAPDHPAMRCLEDCLELGGFEAILRVREFYAE